jgi:hypothetical protein
MIPEVFHNLTLPTEHENRDLRHAGMDSRHPSMKALSSGCKFSFEYS